jgi:hypothetical protein
MFVCSGSGTLEDVIRDRVTAVHIAEEWGGTYEREEVRRALLTRLDTIKARFLKERDAARNS